ncbi:MAG TPA: hypothetical protein PKN96_05080 [Flavobacterium sp.]|uniref:hypothetical protein n=1 Tax=Flavobacterium sp. TaxID=239 RepID=UPI002C9045BE|nr:hypothetical protein [Flavobacterium sp.]HNP32644.1 hypothetical protein [Flavobacterium sp.]
MKQTKSVFLLVVIFLSQYTFSQQTTDDAKSKIAAVLDNYFDLEREAIHLHLDKTTFINNESVWYKGYIINRKTNKPYFTTNVFVTLYNDSGKQLSEKLVYATNGTFSGKIELGPNLDSGNYYIQVYTNWMNNFSENESTITKVRVINPEQGIINDKKIIKESLGIYLNPEGNSLISGVSNTIGVQVKDCRKNAPENLEATVQNSKGEILKAFKLNRFGFGKFDITPSSEKLKVVVNYNDKILEKDLPNAELIGIALEANSFSIEGKTAIKLKTNPSSYNALSSKKLYLIIHQDQNSTIYSLEFKPNELEQTLIVNNSDLKEGINTIRIIDNDLKQWAERLIYINPMTKNNFTIVKNKRNNDKIVLVGYSETQNSTMSISVLPEDTKAIDENNSIIAGITINPYLNSSLQNANYYLNEQSRLKFYELDLALLNQEKMKYSWDLMKIGSPVSNYSFDMGINLKGTIDSSIKDKTKHKVKLITYKDFISTTADVSEKGEYQFEHLLLTDSTQVNLSLQKLPDFEEVKTKLTPQVLNRKRPFNKPFTGVDKEHCIEPTATEDFSNFDLPTIEGKIIKLDEVVVKNNKPKLTYEKVLSNTMLRGYKIDDSNNHSSVLNFIEQNGFVVDRTPGNINITSRGKASLNLPDPTPVVYIDDRQLLFHFDELEYMQMITVDEIYIDAHAIVASMNNNQGIIKIYTKKLKTGYFSKPNPNAFFIKDAFTDAGSFKNADYQNTQTKGFDNFGIIGWLPKITSDESGNFQFEVIDYNKSKCRTIIEGMTPDGKLYHQEKTVELK